MLNHFVAFKDTIIKKFGPVLGYVILIIAALIALSLLGFLVRTVFKLVIWLLVAGIIVFGVYKLVDLFKK